MEFNEKIGQTALTRHGVLPGKHSDQQPVYTPPSPFMPLSLYFPILVPLQTTLIPPFPHFCFVPYISCNNSCIIPKCYSWHLIICPTNPRQYTPSVCKILQLPVPLFLRCWVRPPAHGADDPPLRDLEAAETGYYFAYWVTGVSPSCRCTTSGIFTVCGARLLSHKLTVCGGSSKNITSSYSEQLCKIFFYLHDFSTMKLQGKIV